MQKTLPAIRCFPATARFTTEATSKTIAKQSRLFFREATSPPGPSILALASSERSAAPTLSYEDQATIHSPSSTKLPKWPLDVRLESISRQLASLSSQKAPPKRNDYGAKKAAQVSDAGVEAQQGSLESWQRLLITLRAERGHDGAWDVFQLISAKGLLRLFALPQADLLRDGVLTAALDHDGRIGSIIRVAHELHTDSGFKWPGLYLKIMHYCLERSHFTEAWRCHLHLYPCLPPGTEVFEALLSSFVLDPSSQMQDTLKRLYIFSTERRLYDLVIPVLFSSGQSRLARGWRTTFIRLKDFPTTTKSSPFLAFVASYYPFIALTDEELCAARFSKQLSTCDDARDVTGPFMAHDASTSPYSDSITAKWFASLWTSVDFAINLVHQLGLRVIGPRSLQSLALRESDAQGVAARLAQLKKLEIKAAPQTYCKVLIFFAQSGDDDLLSDLVNCDIHPDEFDNEKTRRLLLAASAQDADWRRERLLQAIERVIGTEAGPLSRRLDALLRSELVEPRVGNIKHVLRRMEALGHSMSQDSALQLLKTTFDGLSIHPVRRPRPHNLPNMDPGFVINSAIEFTRRLTWQDAAVPLRYWRKIIYNLGRTGRLAELEQICLEVVQLYLPSSEGLIPVHREDWPPSGVRMPNRKSRTDTMTRVETECCTVPAADHWKKRESTRPQAGSGDMGFWARTSRPHNTTRNDMDHNTKTNSSANGGLSRQGTASDQNEAELGDAAALATGDDFDENGYIPADLPFTHRQHPLHKLFDSRWQRSVVRWGFDQTLTTEPSVSSLMETSALGIRGFDVACGVRLLAILRDRGVFIDAQTVRSAVITRIALGRVPGRRRHRSRDMNEMSVEHLKNLVERAWGSAIFSTLSELLRELERRKPKLWKRYPRLFGKAYDDMTTWESTKQMSSRGTGEASIACSLVRKTAMRESSAPMRPCTPAPAVSGPNIDEALKRHGW